MIHVVNGNSRDCPWYKRRNCTHPSMKGHRRLGVWHRNSGSPIKCPLRKSVDIIVPGPLPGDDQLDVEKVVKDGLVQLHTWLELRRAAKEK